MDTEERVTLLEQKLADHDRLIGKLIAYARLTPSGRMILALLGIS
jgi:hypothetical protein